MIELLENQFEKVLPLVKELDYNNVVYAIIEKTSKGRIWVDDITKPTIVLLWDAERRFYLAGNYTNENKNKDLRNILTNVIFPFGEKNKLTQWTFHFAPYEWKEILLHLISDYMPIADNRLYYRFDKENCKLLNGWKQKIKKGYQLELVNQTFLDNYAEAENIKDVFNELSSNWFSDKAYYKNGFGYCLIDNNTIASWCLGEYGSSKMKRIEVGIETYESYRKQGFATITGAAFVDYALKKGYNIGWHCWENNIPSAKTAEKIGYKLIKKYPVLFGWYNKIDQLILHGWYNRTRTQNYELAIDLYKQVIDLYEKGDPLIESSYMFDDIQQIHISIAEVKCQLGDLASALDIIQRVIADGYLDFERLKKSEQLEPLKTNQKWIELIEKKK